MLSTLKKIAAITAGSLTTMAFVGDANAAILMQMFDADIPVDSAPFTEPFEFTLPSFDESLGMLTGVEIMTTVDTTAIVSIFNNTGSTQSFTNATSSVTLNVDAPTQVISATAVATEPSGTVAPSPPANEFPGQTATQVENTIIPSGDIASYVGGPGINLSFSANAPAGQFSGSSVPGVFFSGSAEVGGNVKITYTYETQDTPSVPEPATLVGLLAVGGAGLVTRRRKS